MLGILTLLRRLLQPRVSSLHRIHVVEADGPSGSTHLGREVAKVLEYQYIDLRITPDADIDRVREPLVISLSGIGPVEGLTVRVEDVCDLKTETDPTRQLSAVMRALRQAHEARAGAGR